MKPMRRDVAHGETSSPFYRTQRRDGLVSAEEARARSNVAEPATRVRKTEKEGVARRTDGRSYAAVRSTDFSFRQIHLGRLDRPKFIPAEGYRKACASRFGLTENESHFADAVPSPIPPTREPSLFLLSTNT